MRRAIAMCTLLLAAAPARGDAPPMTVLKLDGDNLYIDAGTDAGVGPGARLTLVHIIEARHPVTGKKLRDKVPLGELAVVKSGARISIARGGDALRARVRLGDEVVLAGERRTFPDPWRGPAAAASAAPGDDEREAQAAWQETLGKPVQERVRVWQGYLEEHAGSRFAAAVRAEIAALEVQRRAEDARQREAAQPAAAVRRAVVRLEAVSGGLEAGGPLVFQPPRRVVAGSPVELAFLVEDPDAAPPVGWLHHRSAGEETYHRVELVRDGRYLRATLPGDAVRPPRLELFVDLLAGNEPTAVAGDAASPLLVIVDPPVVDPPPERRGRTRLSAKVDFVDFDGGGPALNYDLDERGSGRWDQYLQSEYDVTYRFFTPIYALRLGFGTMDGVGGPKDVIDADATGACGDGATFRCHRVSFHYAYVEAELRASDTLALMVRPMSGGASLRATGQPEDLFMALGFAARLRIGAEASTNLVLGVSFTQRMGTLFEAAYTWDAVPALPIVLTAQVTNQPVLEDYGVRLIADVGWRRIPWFTPSLRVSYQARDMDHAGVGGGAAVSFEW